MPDESDPGNDTKQQVNAELRSAGKGLRGICIGIALYTFVLGAWMLQHDLEDLIVDCTVHPELDWTAFPPAPYFTAARVWSFVYTCLLLTAAVLLGCGVKSRSSGLHTVWITLFTPYIVGQLVWFAKAVTDFVDHSEFVLASSDSIRHESHGERLPLLDSVEIFSMVWNEASSIVVMGTLLPCNLLCVLLVFNHAQLLTRNSHGMYNKMTNEGETGA